MSKYFLIIEQGIKTTAVYIFNTKKKLVSSAQQTLHLSSPKKYQFEFEPLEMIYCIRSAISKALKIKKIKAGEIGAISIISTNQAAIIWDKETGLPLGKGIPDICMRTEDYCLKLIKNQLNEQIKNTTGADLSPTYLASKFYWLMHNQPEIQNLKNKKNLQIGSLDSWILFNLSGRQIHKTDYTNALKTMLFNLQTLSWDKFLLNEFALQKNYLPTIQASASVFGHTKSFVPLADDIPITCISTYEKAMFHAHHCQNFTSAYLHYDYPGYFIVSTGHENIHLHKSITGVLAQPKLRYSLENIINFPLIPKNFLQTDPSSSKSNIYAQDSNKLFIIPKKIKTFPFFKTPKIHLLSLDFSTTPAEITTAYYYCLAYQIKNYLSFLENKTNITLKEISVSGPSAINNNFLQIQSNALQMPITRYTHSINSCLGAILLANISAKLFSNTQPTFKNIKIEKQFLPELDPISNFANYNEWLSYYQQNL
jgi:glycerol kinase